MGLQVLAPYYNMGETAYNALDLTGAPTYAGITQMVDLALGSLVRLQSSTRGYSR